MKGKARCTTVQWLANCTPTDGLNLILKYVTPG